MNQLASSNFRLYYGRLNEPTEVTVNGHVIGTWLPSPSSAREPIALAEAAAPVPQSRLETPRERQKRIDGVLRKANG